MPGLSRRVERLESAAGFAPLPCPMCALIERHVRAVCDLFGDRLFWPSGAPFTYETVCRFCGRAETRQAHAPDAEAARRFAALLTALATGRFCEVGAAESEYFSERYEQAARESLGADFPKWRALAEGFRRSVRALYAAYRPRAPYVCRVENCGCERATAQRGAA